VLVEERGEGVLRSAGEVGSSGRGCPGQDEAASASGLLLLIPLMLGLNGKVCSLVPHALESDVTLANGAWVDALRATAMPLA
jgi:hypothetical protein